MKLAVKLTLALTLAIASVLALQATAHARRLNQMNERAAVDALSALARSLASAASLLWLRNGRGDVERLVDSVEASNPKTAAKLVYRGDAYTLPNPRDEILMGRQELDERDVLVAVVPVLVDARAVAALEVRHELPEQTNYFGQLVTTQVATTLVLVGVCGLVVLIVGMWLVGRRLSILTNQARRVAQGDYTIRNALKPGDEIGALAREMNLMTEQLNRAHERIRIERQKRTAALEQLRHADRLSTVGKLASTLAHELGTPLNVVSGRAGMIRGDSQAGKEAEKNAEIIAGQARRMTATIQELLEFSRRQPMRRENVSIARVIDHAITLMEPISDINKVDICVEGELDVEASLDSGRTLQVLTNLMMNAIYAMPSGGRLSINVTTDYIADPKDRHCTAGDYVCIKVTDEGVGIPADRLGDIFKPFFTTRSPTEGTGLGLPVCHNIVREHGGWMDVRSTVGKGSCFAVYLPQKEEA